MSEAGAIARGKKYSARIKKNLSLPEQVNPETNVDILAYKKSLNPTKSSKGKEK